MFCIRGSFDSYSNGIKTCGLLLAAILKGLAVRTFDYGRICLMRSYIDVGQATVISVFTVMLTILDCTRNCFISLHKIIPPSWLRFYLSHIALRLYIKFVFDNISGACALLLQILSIAPELYRLILIRGRFLQILRRFL